MKYHEDFEKNIKGSKIQVSDDPETERIRQVNHLVSQVEYKGGTKEKIGNLEARRQSLPPKGTFIYLLITLAHVSIYFLAQVMSF